MAAPTRILSLNLGTQTIGLADFKTSQSGGLILNSYRLTELLADPAADATRLAQMKIAIKDMMDGLKLRSGRINYAISAQSVFTRFVKLPTVGEDKVEQIITFEAQQNVPFPIDDVVWDYQLVGGGDETKLEVVLVAIKADLLDDLNKTVESSGLKTNIVDVAPMTLYNAFRYNYSDVSGCSLLIDIGARTTNLIFVETQKVFSRSIPIGGNTISAAIAKDFNEPFGAAEERKKKVGFVSLGGSYAEPSDPDIARVSKMIRNTMTRLHAEISRSISFYRSQQQGSAPSRVYLCGGSSGLPYMREFFNEKLQLPIEFFNPLRNVAVGANLNVDEVAKSAHVLGELVGLSLRNLSECPMELNLRPAGVVKAQKLAERQPYVVMAGISVLLCLAGWWLYFWRAGNVESEVLQKIDPQVKTLKGFEQKFADVRKEIKSLQDTAAPFLQAVDERGFWVRVIDDLNARLPARFIWITVLDEGFISADGKFTPVALGDAGGAATAPPNTKLGLRIHGLYLTNPRAAGVVDDFVKNLQDSPYFKLEGTPIRATPTQTEWAFDYEIRLSLKQPFNP